MPHVTRQCARFSSAPKNSHIEATRWLVRCLKGSRDKGHCINPKSTLGLELYVNADFSGNWDKTSPEIDPNTTRSRHGYVVKFRGAPITWNSQLQTEMALPGTESEYTGLSYALREKIPTRHMIEEFKHNNLIKNDTTPTIKSKGFEDNSGALEMASIYKYRPRTKHLNVKLHHFRDYVTRKDIEIIPISTTDQLADLLKKGGNGMVNKIS